MGTLVERRSGYRLSRISADLTQKAIIRLLKRRRGDVQTITLDNARRSLAMKPWPKWCPHRRPFVNLTAQDSVGVTGILMA